MLEIASNLGGAKLRYRFCVWGICVEVQADPRLKSALEPLLRSYESSTGAPLAIFKLRAGAELSLIVGNKRFEQVGDEITLLGIFEAALYGFLVETVHNRLILHAAGVGRPGRALVLTGASGMGKSTLALALINRGLSYLSEEWIAVDQKSRAAGLPRPLHVDTVPNWEKRCTRFDVFADDRLTRSQLLLPPLAQVLHGGVPLQGLVILQREDHCAPQLEPLFGPSAALTSLQPHLLFAGSDPLLSVMTLVQSVPFYRLRFSEALSAARLLEGAFFD
jgi:hypothetical protein